jgi:hypothetical protein
MDPGLIEIANEGAGYSVLEYLEAADRRSEIGIHMGRFHAEYDLLLTPAVPIPAFEAGREVPAESPHRRWMSWTPFTYPFNLTKQPAISVPCGFTKAGLPIGMQLVGRPFEDARVLAVGDAYQQVSEWHLRTPTVPATVPPVDPPKPFKTPAPQPAVAVPPPPAPPTPARPWPRPRGRASRPRCPTPCIARPSARCATTPPWAAGCARPPPGGWP